MDTIPIETHVAAVTATVDDLERGLTTLPLSKGVNRIDDWRRELTDTGRDDLRPIADALGELHAALTGEGRDAALIGGLLVRVGTLTEAAAEGTGEALGSGLRRLGSLLRHAGSALA